MKKLIRLAALAAVVAAIVWLLKDRLVPAPGPVDDHPPPFRQPPPPGVNERPPATPAAAAPPTPAAAPPPAPAAEPDDLQAIKGIGPKYDGLLRGMGISTYAALAAADAAQVAAGIRGTSEIQVASWIAAAGALA